MDSITVHQLDEFHKQGEVQLLDVRTPVEYREVHIPFARNVPLNQLGSRAPSAQDNGSGQPLYVICNTGKRSTQACEKLRGLGHSQVVNVEGGTQAWIEAGLPVTRGKKAMSLERQVRIAAGLLVLVGALLAIFVNVYFALLSAFVGAGLTFAGITDTCGMGLLLARMPWNQVKLPEQTESQELANTGPTCCAP